MRRRRRGFTLVELLVTAAIVAVLASVTLPLAELSVKRSRETELRAALRAIRDAIDAYKQAADAGRIARKAGENGYPPSLEALVNGVEDQRSVNKASIYFMRRIPREPLQPDASLPAAQTWGLRSYDSAPDDPREGRDVFDVYSRSERIGLNGIEYRQW